MAQTKTALAVLAGFLILLFSAVNLIRTSYNQNESQNLFANQPSVLLVQSKSHVRIILEKAEEAYQRYIAERKQIVKDSPERINPWPKTGKVIYFYEYFPPAFSCPHTTQRIGRIGDGGKFVCGFELFENPQDAQCILYSFGISQESSFEAEFEKRTSCDIFGYDASVKSMGPEVITSKSRIRFTQLFLGDKNDEKARTKTFRRIMEENGHIWIDVLKMDIEQHEFPVLNQILDDFGDEGLPFGQLQLEIHGDSSEKSQGVGSFSHLYKLWERLEDAGLRPFMNEINNYPCVVKKTNPRLMEYSFINIKVQNRLLQ